MNLIQEKQRVTKRGLPVPARESDSSVLLRDGFSGFPVGQFPCDYSPVGEYHCIIPKGYLGQWTELTTHYSWRGSLGWWVGEDGGRKFLEHVAERTTTPSMFAAGETGWTDYVIDTVIQPIARHGRAGVAFRIVNSQEYYALLLDSDAGAMIVKATFDNTFVTLVSKPLPQSSSDLRRVTIRLHGTRIEAIIDEAVEIVADDGTYGHGGIGVVAFAPIRYHSLSVWTSVDTAKSAAVLRTRRQREVDEIVERLPKPVLWREFDLGDSGAGRSVRFGDLDGDGELEFVMAQCIQRGGTDNIASISCVTAYKTDGSVLWQMGEPNRRHGIVTADLPIQIHDIDGDGAAEVVLCKDFWIRVFDGSTGELKREMPTPSIVPSLRKRSPDDIFDRLSGDSMFFADLTGSGVRREILLKNRYGRIWALDESGNVLWSHECKTGHAPFVGDINGDGRDEVIIGSTMLDADGAVMWCLETNDHVDTAAVVTLAPGAEPVVLLACSDDGLYFLTTKGQLIRNDRYGHMQDLSVGRFRDDLPGLQFWTKTFWGHPGVLFLYSSSLDRVLTVQGYPLGSQVYPINWDGGSLQHILLSAHPSLGGLMDGWGRRIPLLPDDGHPWLCCEPLDVTGDCRDEILYWDLERFCIYTQDRPAAANPTALRRGPHYNFTNYGCHFAVPGATGHYA